MMLAQNILMDAHEAIAGRAAERDQPTGERSMLRCVNAFNAMTGHNLSEHDGWIFMVALKTARAYGGRFNSDDYIDGSAYMALAGECAAKEA